MGWIIVGAIVASLLIAATWLVRKAARRRWDYPVILLLTVVIVPLLYSVTGDMSAWLPGGIWSDGFEGKDQIIVVSAASTILLPLLLVRRRALRRRVCDRIRAHQPSRQLVVRF